MVIWRIPRLRNLEVRQQFWDSGCPDSHLIYTLTTSNAANACIGGRVQNVAFLREYFGQSEWIFGPLYNTSESSFNKSKN